MNQTQEGANVMNVFIPGTPVPQGSMRGYARGGGVVITSANKKTMPWRADIAAVVRSYVGSEIMHPDGPVSVTITFVMPRRASEPKRTTPAHVRKPDIDKLIRAALDAITGIVFTDDSQVVHVTAHKHTAEIGEQPGMHVMWATP
jgi:crossover junction endodeoxyribonuclease RusA